MVGVVVYLLLGMAFAPLAPLVVWIGGLFRPNWRRGWTARFGLTPRRDDRPVVVWCASVGEVNTAQRFIRALLADGRAPLLLAVFTPDGLARAQELFGDRVVATAAPLDSYLFVSLWLRRVRPRAALLFETEVWPTFVIAARRRGVPLGVINGRLSDRAFPRYRLLRWFWRPILQRLTLVSAQTADFAARFRELGARAEAVAVSGSLKFDAGAPSPPVAAVRAIYEAFVAGRQPIVAGSTQEGEEKIAAEAIQALRAEFPRAALLAAPRHLQRADEAAADIRQTGLKLARRSSATCEEAAAADVLLIDAFGELAWAYSLGVAAFVGGSFGDRGGQNMLEPAAAGVPVLVGPRTPNFKAEADALRAAGGLLVVERPADLRDAFAALLRDPARRAAMADAARQAVAAHQGAVARTIKLISEYHLE